MATKKTNKKASGGKTAKKAGAKKYQPTKQAGARKSKTTKTKPAASKSKRKSPGGIVSKVKTVVGKVLAGAASGAVKGAVQGAVEAGSDATGIGKVADVAGKGDTKSTKSEDK